MTFGKPDKMKKSNKIMNKTMKIKVKEISVSFGRKMSDQNYGSRDVFFSQTAELGPEDNALEVQQRLFDECVELARRQFETLSTPKVNQPTKDRDKAFDWKDTRGGQNWLERKQEIDQNFGEENGVRGSSFNDERTESVSGQR